MSALRPPRYLFVCTANMNRSPAMAAWAERLLAERFVVAEIRSAGTHAWAGEPAAAYTVDAMREHGFDLRSHRTTPLDAETLDWADRVIVAQPGHIEVIAALHAAALPKVLGLWRFAKESSDQVPDPHGQPLDLHRESAIWIREAVTALVGQLLEERRARRNHP